MENVGYLNVKRGDAYRYIRAYTHADTSVLTRMQIHPCLQACIYIRAYTDADTSVLIRMQIHPCLYAYRYIRAR
jgi:hypothetical protein